MPLRKQAADEQGRDGYATLRYGVIWGVGTIRAADARQALQTPPELLPVQREILGFRAREVPRRGCGVL
ncbi:hypothetical protein ACIOHS_47710 [Streptomyces sp. NPDC088253]|uniref:hypothetical protein n=1 Tax=Streptomyces sp. NPDC088253 TaxID=3365846 RepID=UPI0038133F17